MEDFEESDDEEDVEDAGNNLVTFKAKKTKSSQSKSVSFGEIPDKGKAADQHLIVTGIPLDMKLVIFTLTFRSLDSFLAVCARRNWGRNFMHDASLHSIFSL